MRPTDANAISAGPPRVLNIWMQTRVPRPRRPHSRNLSSRRTDKLSV